MTRETKIGLAAAGTLLLIVGGVLIYKMKPGSAEVKLPGVQAKLEDSSSTDGTKDAPPLPVKDKTGVIPVRHEAPAPATTDKTDAPKPLPWHVPVDDPSPPPPAPSTITDDKDKPAPGGFTFPPVDPAPMTDGGPAPAPDKPMNPPPAEPAKPATPDQPIVIPPFDPTPMTDKPSNPPDVPPPDPMPMTTGSAPPPAFPETSKPAADGGSGLVVPKVDGSPAPAPDKPPVSPMTEPDPPPPPSIRIVPPIKPQADAPPLADKPTPPAREPQPRATPSPEVDSYDVETYLFKANDTFAGISQQFYQTDRYAQALLLFNRHHPLAAATLQQDPPRLAPGQAVYIPPIRILQKNFARFIAGDTSGAPVRDTAVRPAADWSNKSEERTYKVMADGERMRDIAAKTLGSPDRWFDIAALNRGIDPSKPVPAGAVLRMPENARVEPANLP